MEPLLDSKDTGVEVNTKITKYMFISHEWNAGQTHNFKIAKKGFENLVKFKYSGMTLAYENCLHEEIQEMPTTIQSRIFYLLAFCQGM